ncbi:hypothetical protein [Homoserinibacter sp. GY 40078]|uniref:hypothetical protein n=1 Tax=Homoserinibacter sp. GY 40078 TaxID=2603275 RepID=UPI0011C76D33|nr:hypothetical protein [Homoserinibacter sp. GY 40078]TXK18624.1 hypothetical protein FVQ89_01350 [Homoserinibacter sp. GY 40078]
MLKVADASASVMGVETRIPFRYGIAEMTRAPHVLVRVRIETETGSADGWASEHLPPKWFVKDAALPFADEVAILSRSILAAVDSVRGREAAHAFALVRELDRDQEVWAEAAQVSGLVAGLGVALVERAVIDAVCRSGGIAFADALDRGVLGFSAAEIHPELAGAPPFRAHRVRRIAVRHTVGLADPLTDAEVVDDPGDGLPVSVESAIRTWGVTRFKLKTVGDVEADLARVAGLLELCDRLGVDPRFTIDGNESMRTAEHLSSWMRGLFSSPVADALRARLDAVEQPMYRDVALGEEAEAALTEVGSLAPVIIDESDDRMDTVRRAMDLGYAGGTYKGCKGVFRGLANAALVAHRDRPGRPAVLTAEDLSTIPPLTVAQDLAVASAMGLSHIERNGHLYFARFAPIDPTLADRTVRAHPDAFSTETGAPRLLIAGGALAIGSIVDAPFGLTPLPEPASLTPLTPSTAAALA